MPWNGFLDTGLASAAQSFAPQGRPGEVSCIKDSGVRRTPFPLRPKLCSVTAGRPTDLLHYSDRMTAYHVQIGFLDKI